MILYYLGKLLWFYSFYFFNNYFITSSLGLLSSGAYVGLLQSGLAEADAVFFNILP